MKLFKIFVLFFILFTGCKNENKSTSLGRDCECNLKALQNESVDSSALGNKSEIGADVGGKIAPSKLADFVDVELKGNIKYTNEESYTNTIITKFQNKFPEYNHILINYELRRLFFCAIRSSMCKNSNISNEELIKFDSNEIPKIQEQVFKQNLVNSLMNIPQQNKNKNNSQTEIKVENGAKVGIINEGKIDSTIINQNF